MALTKIDDRGLKTPIDLLDNEKIRLGTGNDLEIFHAGAHTKFINKTGQLRLQSADFRVRDYTNDHEMIIATEDGSVDLYYDNVKTLTTQANGITVLGPEGGSAQINLYSDEGDDNADLWRIDNKNDGTFSIENYTSGSWETNLKLTGNAGVHLYHDNSAVCYTDTDALRFNDNKYLKLGSSQDLQIYHNGSHSYIVNDEGSFFIQAKPGEHSIKCARDGAVELYYNNLIKLETHSAGITIRGEEGEEARILLNADEGDDNADKWRIEADTTGSLNISNYSSGSWERNIACAGSGNVEVFHDNVKKFETTASGISVSGKVIDVYGGDVRRAIQTTKSSAHTLVATDQGKHIHISSGGVTVPNNVLTDGDMVTIVNNSGSDQTITQGSGVTMYNPADASTGNRTLAGRGVCTILFTSGSVCYISGAGLS